MTDETIRTIFTCCATLGAVIITQLFTYLSSKSNKTDSIYKQQYDNIFSPIHRILFFADLKDDDKIKRIYNVIYSNYNLSTELLRKEFKKCTSKNRITPDFEDVIDDGCKCLEKALGYTKTKLSKQQKERSKTVIYSEDYVNHNLESVTLTIISIMFSLIMAIVVIFISFKYNIEELIENFIRLNDLEICIGIISILTTISICYVINKKKK